MDNTPVLFWPVAKGHGSESFSSKKKTGDTHGFRHVDAQEFDFCVAIGTIGKLYVISARCSQIGESDPHECLAICHDTDFAVGFAQPVTT